MDVSDKVVLITGGAAGIGLHFAQSLEKMGAKIAILDIDEKRLEEVSTSSPQFFCTPCDITQPEQVERAVRSVYEHFNGLDILINNAGILFSAPLIGLTSEGLKKHDYAQWNRVINTNLNAVFYVTTNVVETFAKHRTSGLIINISSVCAAGNAGQSAYSAAKAGVNALTATWSKELAPWGVRVVGLAPGYIDMGSTVTALSESRLKEIRAEIPLRRLGTIEELTQALFSLIQNDFFHGKTLELDGGLVI